MAVGMFISVLSTAASHSFVALFLFEESGVFMAYLQNNSKSKKKIAADDQKGMLYIYFWLKKKILQLTIVGGIHICGYTDAWCVAFIATKMGAITSHHCWL